MGIVYWFKSLFSNAKDKQARQLRIDELNRELEALELGKIDEDFFGITSNGMDCIYFVKKDGRIQIEFEAIMTKQLPYIEKLEAYAKRKGFESKHITYGNKPDYNATEAPVLQMLIHATSRKATDIAKEIQLDIFENTLETKYDVVP